MKIYITTLDRRHNGYGTFLYMARISEDRKTEGESIASFNEVRDWAWQTWGGSCALEEYTQLKTTRFSVNSHWAWSNCNKRILITTEADLSWFILRWSEHMGT
jgi:hypothetical protein